MNKATFQEAVNQGFALGRWEQLGDWVAEESNYVFKDGDGPAFDEGIFKELLLLLVEPSFIGSDNSSNALKMLEYDWASFSTGQTEELRGVLVTIYDKLLDPLSWFIISELLGEYYADPGALEDLRSLKRIVIDDEPRSLIPMSFEKLILYSPSETVKADALIELIDMKDDPSEQVRAEVETSFNRLNN